MPFFKMSLPTNRTRFWLLLGLLLSGSFSLWLIPLQPESLALAEAMGPGESLSPLVSGFWISWPLMVGGILHMIAVKLNLFSGLNRPLSLSAFGSNKTWRGLIVMPLGTLIGMASLFALPRIFGGNRWGLAWPQDLLRFLTQSGLGANPFWIALAVGFAYVLFELPNSWIKRRLGVAPGELPRQRRLLFAAGDQLDSTLGCALAYAALTQVNWLTLGVCLVLGPAIHLTVNLALYGLGIRKRPL